MGVENAALMLVEFDSTRGPIIRKKSPNNFKIPIINDQGNFLMWVLRAEDFSVRKVGNYTAYARALSLRDPNFPRKNRQFGFVIVTQTTIEFQKVNGIIDDLIKKAKGRSNNKPYFKMLYELLETFKEIKKEQATFNSEGKTTGRTREGEETKVQQMEQISSNRLTVFNKIIIYDKKNEVTILVKKNGLERTKKGISKQLEASTDRIIISSEVQYNLQNGLINQLHEGLMIFARMLEAFPSKQVQKERILVGVEYFDRLLQEKVDIPYFLPFLQYLIFMESFTIEVVKTQEFNQNLAELIKTHGSWIEKFDLPSLEGKQLSAFFNLVKIKREALEVLIDLLFLGIIELF
ncbi:MAG: hypothetical protein GF308_09950 [Candidatus Heimdallarchaeota archaeon]|nr:hypothetical protein [Candidatus Heimdallarchaeota archaeon]